MKIAFTICSNNYLGQAKVLIDSIRKYSSDYNLYVILCDKKSKLVDYSKIQASILECEDLGIGNFDWMVNHYNIVELNTALKPFAFQYLFNEIGGDIVLYFDPDIRVYHSLDIIEQDFAENNILLTPHSFAPLPIEGKKKPDDTTFLNYGIYNLGFLGLRNHEETFRMLDWWGNILSEHCFGLEQRGFFVDQLPMNLTPLYFKGVKISENRGLNVAWWNIHERKVLHNGDGTYSMSNGDSLVFFHFSNYKLSKPKELSIPGRYNRSSLSDDKDLESLFMEYATALANANKDFPNKIKCFYYQNKKKYITGKIKDKVYLAICKLASLYMRLS